MLFPKYLNIDVEKESIIQIWAQNQKPESSSRIEYLKLGQNWVLNLGPEPSAWILIQNRVPESSSRTEDLNLDQEPTL